MEETRTPKGVLKMKKILASLAAAGVLVAGVATAAVISGSEASAQEAPETEEATEGSRPQRGTAVQEVLDELVADNTISQSQADAISAALQEKWEEIKAERPEGKHGPGFRRGFRGGYQLRGLLEDGVIDAEELAALPDGHVLTDPEGPFAEVAADGEITEEEFRSVVEALRESGEGRFRPRFGGEAPDVEGTSA